MNLLPCFLGKFLLVNVQLGNGEMSFTVSKFKWNKHGTAGTGIPGETAHEVKNNNCLAVILVSGAGVVTKTYLKDGPDIMKITGNDRLTVQKHPEEDEYVTISFFRSDILTPVISEMKKNGIMILDIFICREAGVLSGDRLRDLLQERLSLKALSRSKARLNTFFELMFRKLWLPVLLSFFVVLLANFFLNGYLRSLLERNNMIYGNLIREVQVKNDNQTAIARLMADYSKQGGNVPFSLICDRLASYVPDGISLDVLTVNPVADKIIPNRNFKLQKNLILIKGQTDTPGSIIEMSRRLVKESMFGQINILSMTGRKDSGKLDFELAVTIK